MNGPAPWILGTGGLTGGRLTADLNDELLDWTVSGMRTSGGQRMLDVLKGQTREARRRRFEHVQRRDTECVDRRMLRLELADSRSIGRPGR